MKDLKNCPFCGSKAVIHHNSDRIMALGCSMQINCITLTYSEMCQGQDFKTKLVNNWNERKEDV